MENNLNYNSKPKAFGEFEASSLNVFLGKVFTWMFAGLIVSFLSALFVASNPKIIATLFTNSILLFLIIGAEIGLVIYLNSALKKMSFVMALSLFMLYSLLNGITLSAILLVFSASSLSIAFFSAASIFGVMAYIGRTTKKDISSWSSFLYTGLIGIVIASVLNLFFRSDAISFVSSFVAVIVFSGLTAYDMHKLKNLYSEAAHISPEKLENYTVIGALHLYLDFINLFIAILRIIGRRD